jgi:hypothetical protein
MPWAYNLIAVQLAAGDFRPVMGTNVFPRIKFTAKVEHGHLGAIDIDYHVFPVRQRMVGAYCYPTGHGIFPHSK